MRRNNNKKSKQQNKGNKRLAKLHDIPLSISTKFNLNKIAVDIEATQPVYLRTSQTIASFASGSQVYAINLCTLIASSNNFTKFLTSGVPNFEYIRCTGFSLAWFPSNVSSVPVTFEPASFDFRYFPSYSTDSVLPSGYYGNYNESHYSVLLQQTGAPRRTTFSLKELPVYLVNESNRQCLGQMINAYNFTNYASTHGGILSLIQTTPSVNTVAAYNPKLGFIELKFHIELFNSVV
jgi:hypothetical protein